MNVLKQIFGRDQSPESATVTCESTVNGAIEFNESGEGNALIMENVDDFLNKGKFYEISLSIMKVWWIGILFGYRYTDFD